MWLGCNDRLSTLLSHWRHVRLMGRGVHFRQTAVVAAVPWVAFATAVLVVQKGHGQDCVTCFRDFPVELCDCRHVRILVGQ